RQAARRRRHPVRLAGRDRQGRGGARLGLRRARLRAPIVRVLDEEHRGRPRAAGAGARAAQVAGIVAVMNREFAFPGTRPKWAPDRVVDIQHLALVIEVDPARRSVAGTATLRVAVIAPGLTSVELDAVE